MSKPDTGDGGNASRRVKCPGCGQPCWYASSNPHRPFCSDRCKNADLGAWAMERYRVGTAPEPDSEDATSAEPKPPH